MTIIYADQKGMTVRRCGLVDCLRNSVCFLSDSVEIEGVRSPKSKRISGFWSILSLVADREI